MIPHAVRLTEVYPPWRGFMMDPVRVPARRLVRRSCAGEGGSFSEGGGALVFHHPDCTYFGVGNTET